MVHVRKTSTQSLPDDDFIMTLFGVSSVFYLNSESRVVCCVGSAEIQIEI